MLIEAGYDIAFDCPGQTPMLLQLHVHPSRDADLLTADRIGGAYPVVILRNFERRTLEVSPQEMALPAETKG